MSFQPISAKLSVNELFGGSITFLECKAHADQEGHNLNLVQRVSTHSCGTLPKKAEALRGISPRLRGMFIAVKVSWSTRQAVAAGGAKACRQTLEGGCGMKVKDVMTPNAKAIWLTESLADAAKLMWENDCGVLPIIKDGRKVIGMITDRDICMAMAMRDTKPSGISVEEVMTGQVYAVKPEDNIDQALQTMQEHKIRRLPVISSEGELEGILSMNDVVLNARDSKGAAKGSINYGEVVKTYQAICQHPVPAAASATASM